MKNILLYMDTVSGKRLQDAILNMVPSDQLTICRTVQELTADLLQSPFPFDIVVLFMATQKGFFPVLSVRYLLIDHRVILVLPDRNRETIASGHSLFPRFISYADGDLSDVTAVLSRMLNRHPARTAGHAAEQGR